MVRHGASRQLTGGVHRRRARVLLVALGVTATALTGPAVRATAGVPGGGIVAAPRVPVLHWTACGDGFECATAAVPLDYGRLRGASVSLALVRLPATDRRHRIGSLLVNPGG